MPLDSLGLRSSGSQLASSTGGGRVTRVGIVGTGRWGLNHVRTFAHMTGAEISMLCDVSASALRAAQSLAPYAAISLSMAEVLQSDGVDAVVIATPNGSHAQLAKAALQAGKHVFVEKPLAMTLEDAVDLVELAEREKLSLMVGHLMLFHPSVRILKELIDSGELGELRQIRASRLNPPSPQRDDAMWNLAPHDIALALYLVGQQPLSVRASKERGPEDAAPHTAIVDLRFESVTSTMRLSRVHARKERRTMVVGSRRTAEFNEVDPTHQLRMHGTPVEVSHRAAAPLKLACEDFVRCVQDGAGSSASGRSAVEVIRVLDAAERSIAASGAEIHL